MSKEYDLIVLGTGGAGYQVAMKARKAGWKVAAIDEGPFGGTCAVRGCVPKKILSGTSQIIDFDRRLMDLDIIETEPKLNWKALIKHKKSFTDSVPEKTIKNLKEAGIDVYEGSPQFTGNIEITIGNEILKTKKAHIAVGAKPAKLPIEGFEHLITSDDFLALNHLPNKIIFVGAGYVSFELAHIAARFNSSVTILHKDTYPLERFDEDIVKKLLVISKEVDIHVELNSQVQKIEKHNKIFKVMTNDQEYEADLVVHGAGRLPPIADLNLEAVNVEYDPREGIKVNEYLQTTNSNIYAAGDAASDGPPLSPVASRQGAIVADNLFGKNHKQPNYLSTPSVVFTTPAIAKVGLLEKEAKGKNLNYEVITKDLSGWLDNKRLNIKHAMSKVLVEKGTNKILGAHLIGNHAEEIINIFGLAIELGLTTEQLKKPILTFPTAGDDMRSMF